MRRPSTIVGLGWVWLRTRPRRIALAVGVVFACVIAVGAALSPRDAACPLDRETWRAGLGEYDFLQSLSLGRGGAGHYVYGYAQAVRFEARFRYEVLDEETLELREFVAIDADGEEHPLDWPAQRVGYEVSEGRYCFEPPYGQEECYRCRLTLGSSPLHGSFADHYACAVERLSTAVRGPR